jgi:LacI family transcriptional regulator
MGITVPDDVAFVGFDGSETFAFNIYPKGITYIKQPIEQFGYEAFHLLVANIVADGKTDVVNIELNPELVVKESSKKS